MAPKYESLQAILEEAGLSHAVLAEEPNGTVDGSNKAFTTDHKPLTDSNYDDVVDATDLRVYVDGVPVAVTSIDAAYGIITLAAAPTVDAEVRIDYRYSPIPSTMVAQRRNEAQNWLNGKMKGIDPASPYTGAFNDVDNPINDTVREICRSYAAAMLLIRDYGYNQDTEGTSKDGFYRLKLVTGDSRNPGLIGDFIASGGVGGAGNNSIDEDDVVVESSGDLFGDFDGGQRPNSDCDW